MKKIDEQEYKANLTGEPFLLFEIKQVANLLHNGYKLKEIKDKVVEENLFQYETQKSILKRFNSVRNRLSFIDDDLISFLATSNSETAKIINLYTIFLSNRLFREFIIEVVYEKFLLGQNKIENVDLIRFFRNKKELDDRVASWGDYTITKLKQVFLRIILEAGLLNYDDIILRLLPYPDFKLYMQTGEGKLFLACIEGEIT